MSTRKFEKIVSRIHRIFLKYKFLYKKSGINLIDSALNNNIISLKHINVSKIDKRIAKYLIKMCLEHRIDLLGSGWVKNSYASESLGVENYKYNMNVKFDLEKILRKNHVQRAKKIWELIDKNYEPIDWQKDYKSGYRWSQRKWCKDAYKVVGKYLGVDIKVPWELARMQHLSQLAVFSLVCPEYKKQSIKEFKNQVLDFIAINPPYMGVNWACTMDVAIRAVNMLVAYDMFSQLDDEDILNEEFKKIFASSIYEHGDFIVNNLEWNEKLTSNHYLANVAGLLFIGAYLDKEDWISFAVSEIIKETKKQFYEDGGNFESSTSYHRLSGEMVLFSTALMLRLIKEGKIRKIDYRIFARKLRVKRTHEEHIEELPKWFIYKVYRIGKFTADIIKPNGEIPQIGDNDSGRFIKLSPVGNFITNREAEEKYLNLRGYLDLIKDYDSADGHYWDENILNHKPFLASFYGIFKDKRFEPYAKEFPLETSFIEALSGGEILRPPNISYVEFKIDKVLANNLSYKKTWEYKLPFKVNKLEFTFYPQSGIYIYKNDKFYLCFYCTPVGQNGNGGHTHNDKQSVELWIDGEDILRDPGTYIYTPLPFRRNEFRSVKVHNTIIVDNLEQNDWFLGSMNSLFKLKNETKCSVVSMDRNFIAVCLRYKDIIHIREVKILEDRIKITDYCNKPFKQNFSYEYYSNGYGKLIKQNED